MEKEKKSYTPGEPIKTRYRTLNNDLKISELLVLWEMKLKTLFLHLINFANVTSFQL